MPPRYCWASYNAAMLELDGSQGEGGGQILRTSLALSLITQTPFHLVNVRAGRSKPGLQPQHLASVRAAATIGSARLRGDSIGSQDLTFDPGPVAPGRYRFAIGTAGATSLVLHTIYLPLAYHARQPSEIEIQGGTHVSTSPCFHFLDVTWRRYLEQLGFRLSLRMGRPGYYPRGGGEVSAILQPIERIRPLRLLSRGPMERVTGVSAVAGLPDHIAQRQARRATTRLTQRGLHVSIDTEQWEGGPASVLLLRFESSPVPVLFGALGARGKPAEAVADEAVDQALTWWDSGAPVDAHSADQLVLPLALADGPSELKVAEVTRHLVTNIGVIRQFLPREISCDGEHGAAGVVRIAAPGL